MSAEKYMITSDLLKTIYSASLKGKKDFPTTVSESNWFTARIDLKVLTMLITHPVSTYIGYTKASNNTYEVYYKFFNRRNKYIALIKKE